MIEDNQQYIWNGECPMSKSYSFFPLGDSAVHIQFENIVSEKVHRQVTAMTRRIEQNPFPGWIECIHSYTSVAVYYDYDKIGKPDGFDTVFAYVCSMLERGWRREPERRTPRNMRLLTYRFVMGATMGRIWMK